jgi:hypothetical protein
MPEPYYYKAETGIFGPFDLEKMHAWNQGGFFARDLLVGRKRSGPFIALGSIREFALATDSRSVSSPERSPVAVVGERLRTKSFAVAAQEDDAMSAALAQAKQLFETSVITHDQYLSIMKAHGKFTSWKSNETDSGAAAAAADQASAAEAPQSHGVVALPLGTCTLCKEQVAMHLFSEHRCSGGGTPSEMECDVASIDVRRVIGEFGSASRRLARGGRSMEGLIESAQRETLETAEYVSTKRIEVSSLRAECEALKVEIAQLRAEAEGDSSPRRSHGRSRSVPNSSSPRSEPRSGSSSPRQQPETRKQRRPSATQLLRKKLGLSPKSAPG